MPGRPGASGDIPDGFGILARSTAEADGGAANSRADGLGTAGANGRVVDPMSTNSFEGALVARDGDSSGAQTSRPSHEPGRP